MDETIAFIDENVTLSIRSADLWMKIAAGQELLGDKEGGWPGQAQSVCLNDLMDEN